MNIQTGTNTMRPSSGEARARADDDLRRRTKPRKRLTMAGRHGRPGVQDAGAVMADTAGEAV
ncbi:hypothetical protein CH75_01930 [Dyella jiangningensis]|nr:hypothetical protein CH75_01930 [Dyella jiangningensis]